MKVRTAEARLRNRLRAYLRKSGYIDHMRGAAGGMDDELTRADDSPVPAMAKKPPWPEE